MQSSITCNLATNGSFDRINRVTLKAFQVEHATSAERIIVLRIRGVTTEMLGNAATHGAFAVLSTGEKLHPELQPLHYDRASSLSTHDMSREELTGAKSVTFDLSDFAGNPISTSKIILWFEVTVQ